MSSGLERDWGALIWERSGAAIWRRSRTLAALALSTVILGAVWGATTWYLASDERLGSLSFPTSCSWQSQRAFTVGTSLLHLFQFADAEQVYREIVTREPDCAIAYWGIAMSKLQNPLYAAPSDTDVDAARQALAAADTARYASPRERAYLAAVGTLFEPGASADLHERFVAYARAMERVTQDFPADLEARIFYALALNMSASPTDISRAERTKAAELLLQAFSEEPNHPGIAHYLTFCLGHAKYQPKPFERAVVPRPMQRAALGGFALLALLGLGAFIAWTSDFRPGASGRDDIGGPFALVAGDGTVVTDRTFRGQWMLIYFGYTHCPDICPTTLLAISQALQKLGPLSARVRPIFISLDPDRDTPKIVDEFVKSFDPNIVGLTGRPSEIAAVARQYRVFYQKVQTDGSVDYLLDHSSYIYVMGPDGRYVTLLSHDETEQPDEIAARLRELVGQPSPIESKGVAKLDMMPATPAGNP